MYAPQPGPPRFKPTPTDGPELHVHPQRTHTIDAIERRFVCIFLRRYVIWCARRGRVDEIRTALDLLIEDRGRQTLNRFVVNVIPGQ